ncbi:phosphatidylglycerol phospholipase C, partial [Phenoliferia sp. Uapishka_3]
PFAQDNSPTPPTPLKRAASRPTPSPLPTPNSRPVTPPQFRSVTSSPPGVKRALASEASPRTSPAKKVAGLGELRIPSPTTGRSDERIPSGSRRISSGGAIGRRKGRVVSGASATTIRAPSPAELATSPARQRDVFDEGMDTGTAGRDASPGAGSRAQPKSPLDPFDQAREHLLDLRLKLSRGPPATALRTKENLPMASGMPRSPNTRNVFLKANSALSNMSDTAKDRPFDAAAMLRWADRLGTLLDSASQASAARLREAEEASQMEEDGGWGEGSSVEFERDLLSDELASVRQTLSEQELEKLEIQEERDYYRSSLEAVQGQNAVLQETYTEMCKTVTEAYTGYQDELENSKTLFLNLNRLGFDLACPSPVSLLIKERTPVQSHELVDRLELALLEKTELNNFDTTDVPKNREAAPPSPQNVISAYLRSPAHTQRNDAASFFLSPHLVESSRFLDFLHPAAPLDRSLDMTADPSVVDPNSEQPAPSSVVHSAPTTLQPAQWPLCWGHRGASAAYPENTLASFQAAIRDGAEGIESGSGRIQAQNYHNGLDKLLTRKTPRQKIPTFRETIDLLYLPENRHVSINIDIKPSNDPGHLFKLMHTIISKHEGFETLLGPRLVLGLWHPKYLDPAKAILPYARRIHIGVDTNFVRKYFWDDCDGFSMRFGCLVGKDGQAFRAECKAAGKDVYVWTVNNRKEMIEATKWGARGILTDRTAEYLSLREEMKHDWPAVSAETSRYFGWTSIWYFAFVNGLSEPSPPPNSQRVRMVQRIAAVVGATGTQGFSVVQALAGAGYHVRALTRTPKSAKAKALFTRLGSNVEPFSFDHNDSTCLHHAFAGVEVVFAVTVPEDDKLQAPAGSRAAIYEGLNETEQGIAMAEAAKRAGVKRYIWSTLSDACVSIHKEKYGDILSYSQKSAVNKRVAALGLPAVQIRQGWFSDNLSNFEWVLAKEDGSLSIVVPHMREEGDTIPLISVSNDTGRAVLCLLDNWEKLDLSKAINFAQGLYSGSYIRDTIQRVSGRMVTVDAPDVFCAPNSDYDRVRIFTLAPFFYRILKADLLQLMKYTFDPETDYYPDGDCPDKQLAALGFVFQDFAGFVRDTLLPHLQIEPA